MRKKFYSNLTLKHIVYNACNEDPSVDSVLMDIDPESVICMLCSAGCNALHYLLDDPAHIDCIDFNPCQIALADLKFTTIKSGRYEDLWNLFSMGTHPDVKSVYRHHLRDKLLPVSTKFWDRNMNFFRRGLIKKGLYYHSLSGSIPMCLDWIKKKDKEGILKLFQTKDLEEQKALFDQHLTPYLNGKFMRLLVNTMFKTGLPSRQLSMIHNNVEEVHQFLLDRIRYVLTELPGHDNYFYYQYFFGQYNEDCCPEYLKEENFAMFKDRADRIQLHHADFGKFLEKTDQTYTHFFLLDHLDWLIHDRQKLSQQWLNILGQSRVGTKILIRTFLPGLEWLPEEFKGHVNFTKNIDDAVSKDRVGHYQETYLLKVTTPLSNKMVS